MASGKRSREASEIKMFINQPEIDEIMKKDDQATAYILHQNSVLVQQNIDLVNEKNAIEIEKDELESFNDRLEKTRTCLQGYVRNEHDMMIKYKALYEHHKSVLELYHTEFIFTQIVPAIIFIIACMSKRLNTYIVSVLFTTCFVGHITIMYYTYIYLTSMRNTKEIREIIEDIAKTKKSNSYIDELIDNM